MAGQPRPDNHYVVNGRVLRQFFNRLRQTQNGLQFDRQFGNAEFPSDDLIGSIESGPHHDFLFAGCELVKKRSVFRSLFFALGISQRSVHRFLHNFKQIERFDGLFQETDGTTLHGAHCHRNVAVTGQKNDRKLASALDQFPMHLHAGESLHAHVKNDAARPLEIGFFQKSFAAFVILHFPTPRFEKHHLGDSKEFVVVNQADQRNVRCHVASFLGENRVQRRGCRRCRAQSKVPCPNLRV